MRLFIAHSKFKVLINPRLTKLFFVTRLTKGGCCNPSLDFSNQTPYEIDFGINRDFAFFCFLFFVFLFERTKHRPRRNLRSYLVLQRPCNEAALSPGIGAFWY